MLFRSIPCEVSAAVDEFSDDGDDDNEKELEPPFVMPVRARSRRDKALLSISLLDRVHCHLCCAPKKA